MENQNLSDRIAQMSNAELVSTIQKFIGTVEDPNDRAAELIEANRVFGKVLKTNSHPVIPGRKLEEELVAA